MANKLSPFTFCPPTLKVVSQNLALSRVSYRESEPMTARYRHHTACENRKLTKYL